VGVRAQAVWALGNLSQALYQTPPHPHPNEWGETEPSPVNPFSTGGTTAGVPVSVTVVVPAMCRACLNALAQPHDKTAGSALRAIGYLAGTLADDETVIAGLLKLKFNKRAEDCMGDGEWMYRRDAARQDGHRIPPQTRPRLRVNVRLEVEEGGSWRMSNA
jgi:hypothetical protein